MIDYSENKAKIIEMLTDVQLYKIISALQKPHGIECLWAAYTYTHTPEKEYVWGHAKAIGKKIREKTPNFTVNDGTSRARWIELAELGLVESTPIDPLKNNYRTTPLGDFLAESFIGSLYSRKFYYLNRE